jgi:NADH-quinone oxidoreductase subunit J
MTLAFAILAGLTVGAAVAAMTLRNLVHSSLCVTVSLIGLALLYLNLGAEFAAFVQILVYVGAVAILIVFAVLLTRSGEAPVGKVTYGLWSGIAVALTVFGALAWAISGSSALKALPQGSRLRPAAAGHRPPADCRPARRRGDCHAGTPRGDERMIPTPCTSTE